MERDPIPNDTTTQSRPYDEMKLEIRNWKLENNAAGYQFPFSNFQFRFSIFQFLISSF
jgi:hypothetical protein